MERLAVISESPNGSFILESSSLTVNDEPVDPLHANPPYGLRPIDGNEMGDYREDQMDEDLPAIPVMAGGMPRYSEATITAQRMRQNQVHHPSRFHYPSGEDSGDNESRAESPAPSISSGGVSRAPSAKSIFKRRISDSLQGHRSDSRPRVSPLIRFLLSVKLTFV